MRQPIFKLDILLTDCLHLKLATKEASDRSHWQGLSVEEEH